MWQIDYHREVVNYFKDNGDLVFDLLVKIEELKFSPDGTPFEGHYVALSDGVFVWTVLGHTIMYVAADGWLAIEAIMPVED